MTLVFDKHVVTLVFCVAILVIILKISIMELDEDLLTF